MNRDEIIVEVQEYCADLLEAGTQWTGEDSLAVAALLNRDSEPWALFRFMDEKTGSWRVGYKSQRTRREWFPILRQMRNTTGPDGLLENLARR